MSFDEIVALIGEENEKLLSHVCEKVPKGELHLPSPDFIDTNYVNSNRNAQTLRNMQAIFNSGRLAQSGYLSILPVDQGAEHSACASFAANPIYFDPGNIVRLAIEGGCNAVASTIGCFSQIARKYAHKISFIVKLNHNELLTYPNRHDQTWFGSVSNAWNLGAAAIGATIYFGSEQATRQIAEVATVFEEAHSLGMPTILWCYLRNPAFKQADRDYHYAADLTGQANYLGSTIQADIIKQKLPTCNGGFEALNTDSVHYGAAGRGLSQALTSDNPIDLCRYQLINCYMGRVGLISSGGPSQGAADVKEAILTAIVNKRAGGMGVIGGRKAFQRPFKEGVDLLHSIQDVYLSQEIGVA